MEVFAIDPSDEADYRVDWGPFLADNGNDTIGAVAWTVPAGLTQIGSSNTTTVATIRVKGATAGQQYVVACKITLTTSGEKFEQSFTLNCEQR